MMRLSRQNDVPCEDVRRRPNLYEKSAVKRGNIISKAKNYPHGYDSLCTEVNRLNGIATHCASMLHTPRTQRDGNSIQRSIVRVDTLWFAREPSETVGIR